MPKPARDKTAFVLSVNPNIPAQRVSELAAARGIRLTSKHVNVIRWKARQAGKPMGKLPTTPPPAAAATATGLPHLNAETLFKRLVLRHLGYDRAVALLATLHPDRHAASITLTTGSE